MLRSGSRHPFRRKWIDRGPGARGDRVGAQGRADGPLLDDLHERGRLQSTLVAVITEFGRTPTINKTAGRDHWSNVFSIVMAGGGLQSGQFIGTSNSRGEVPQDRPIHINDVLATIYTQLGVPTGLVHYDDGRPVPVLYEGKAIDELI